MDPEPVSVPKPSQEIDFSSSVSDLRANEEEDPYSLSGPSIALFGLAIAVFSIAVPLAAVLTERPLDRETKLPTALQRDGFKSPRPISFTRDGKSSS